MQSIHAIPIFIDNLGKLFTHFIPQGEQEGFANRIPM
jgi:hypothetical protein